MMKTITLYYIYMAYPTQKRYYVMDMKSSRKRAEDAIRKMKREGYAGMKFKIKSETKKVPDMSRFIE